MCRNMEGIQTSIPSGMIGNTSFDCFVQPVYQPTQQQPTPEQVIVEPKPTCDLTAYLTKNSAGVTVGAITWHSQNAYAVENDQMQKPTYINGVFVDNSVASGTLVGFQTVEGTGKQRIMSAVFVGKGGKVTCEATFPKE